MNILTEETVNAFLSDLTELTRKHGIEISGCGCCGSPYIRTTSNITLRYTIDDLPIDKYTEFLDNLRYTEIRGE